MHSSYQKRIRPHPSFLPSWEGKLKNATTPSPGVTETESSCPTFPDRGMGSEPERPRGRRPPWHLNQERIRENVKTGASVPGQQQLGCSSNWDAWPVWFMRSPCWSHLDPTCCCVSSSGPSSPLAFTPSLGRCPHFADANSEALKAMQAASHLEAAQKVLPAPRASASVSASAYIHIFFLIP